LRSSFDEVDCFFLARLNSAKQIFILFLDHLSLHSYSHRTPRPLRDANQLFLPVYSRTATLWTPKTEHTCHDDSMTCPPCFSLTTKDCACGKTSVANVKMFTGHVS
jgi:hypothetical protein